MQRTVQIYAGFWLPQHSGYTVGAAYMPPVAAIPVMRYNGQTPRDAYMRPLQTCRKRRTITGLRGNKNIPHRRGGALPRPRPNGNCDITGKPHGGVGSPRPTAPYSHTKRAALAGCPFCIGLYDENGDYLFFSSSRRSSRSQTPSIYWMPRARSYLP